MLYLEVTVEDGETVPPSLLQGDHTNIVKIIHNVRWCLINYHHNREQTASPCQIKQAFNQHQHTRNLSVYYSSPEEFLYFVIKQLNDAFYRRLDEQYLRFAYYQTLQRKPTTWLLGQICFQIMIRTSAV